MEKKTKTIKITESLHNKLAHKVIDEKKVNSFNDLIEGLYVEYYGRS